MIAPIVGNGSARTQEGIVFAHVGFRWIGFLAFKRPNTSVLLHEQSLALDP
ncbi:hypothetical protein NBRC116597_10840 [Phaeobacter sp. NW0010-22]